MRRRDRHHDDLVQRLQQPDAVDDAGTEDIESLVRRVNHGLDGFFGHAGVVLKFQRADFGLGSLISVSDSANETTDRADPFVSGTQRVDLVGEIEVFGLNGYALAGHGQIVAPADALRLFQ